MATAAHIDRGVKAGFAAIKEKMASMAEDIKHKENKEKECIAERDAAKKRAHAAFVKMSEITMQTGEKEEQLRKSTEKLKYSMEKLHEKQGHLTRLGEWNKNITQIPEEKLAQSEANLRTLKTSYVQAKEKLVGARARVEELEMKIEKQENKFGDLSRKEEHMRVQYEHQCKEYELKRKRDAKQEMAATTVEEKFRGIEQNYYDARRRHDVAAVRLKELEVQLSQTEIVCEEVKKKRIAMETTLRELLSSYSKNREIAPPPKYPQAGTAVNATFK